MSDRPITFSPAMVRALLAGTKTQTRRGLTLPKFRKFTEFGPSDTKGYDWHLRDARMLWNDFTNARLLELLPHQAGDRLYVRENWHTNSSEDGKAPRDIDPSEFIWYVADGEGNMPISRFRQARHMPKWASRLTLHVTEVRVQRLQEISEEDAIAEGASCWGCGGKIDGTSEDDCQCFHSKSMAVPSYMVLWESINGERSWHTNPWVTATTFEVERCHIDQARAA